MISQLGRYEVLGELGQGAMGVVYKAQDPLIDRQVAIKTINLSMAQDEEDEYESRFYQEAKAAGRLNHPNIVTIYDVGKSGDIAYIAMEFLQGRELRDILRDDGKMSVAQVLDVVAQVASGLAYAHEHGIVHRDIKPSNIMMIRDGHVKITDFGIARMACSAVRTQTGMVLGSPKYMSPEQVLGKDIDQRSDVFSLGVMLYEMPSRNYPPCRPRRGRVPLAVRHVARQADLVVRAVARPRPRQRPRRRRHQRPQPHGPQPLLGRPLPGPRFSGRPALTEVLRQHRGCRNAVSPAVRQGHLWPTAS